MMNGGNAHEPSHRFLREVPFVQGGGAGAHDAWDRRLVATVARDIRQLL
jgi:hypothetical protein